MFIYFVGFLKLVSVRFKGIAKKEKIFIYIIVLDRRGYYLAFNITASPIEYAVKFVYIVYGKRAKNLYTLCNIVRGFFQRFDPFSNANLRARTCNVSDKLDGDSFISSSRIYIYLRHISDVSLFRALQTFANVGDGCNHFGISLLTRALPESPVRSIRHDP